MAWQHGCTELLIRPQVTHDKLELRFKGIDMVTTSLIMLGTSSKTLKSGQGVFLLIQLRSAHFLKKMRRKNKEKIWKGKLNEQEQEKRKMKKRRTKKKTGKEEETWNRFEPQSILVVITIQHSLFKMNSVDLVSTCNQQYSRILKQFDMNNAAETQRCVG